MTIRKAIIGLCLSSALLVSAVAAPSAGAVGTTAFTCKKETGSTFKWKDEHCKEESSGGNTGQFNHVEIAKSLSTEAQVTNNETGLTTSNQVLNATVAGFNLVIQAESMRTEGASAFENKEEAGGEMLIVGKGKVIYEKVTNAAQKCEVFGLPGGKEKVETKELEATTKGQPAPEEEKNNNMFVEFKPVAGTVLAEFELKGESCPAALTKTHKIVGSVRGRPTSGGVTNGATVEFTETDVTNQNTLKFESATGPKAGLKGKITIAGRKNNTESFTPVAATTK